jgi:hypothetical protein
VPSPNTGFVAVAAGGYHSLGLKADGLIVAWGDNDQGQSNVPSPNTGFVAVAAGEEHSLGLKADGSIVAWGSIGSVPSPNTGFVAVAAGGSHSLGIKADGSVADNPAIRAAKLQTDGVFACVYGGIISAAWPNEFYIEVDNRSCGIRIEKIGHGLAQGKRANVAGIVSTNADGERYIETSYVFATPFSGIVKPLGIPNRSLGGGDFGYDPGPPESGQRGVTGGAGLNNIGLLVRVWGRVVEIEPVTPPTKPTWFKIDDGSGRTIKCVAEGGSPVIDPLWQGKYAVVTGISSCEFDGENLVSKIRLKKYVDPTIY